MENANLVIFVEETYNVIGVIFHTYNNSQFNTQDKAYIVMCNIIKL